MLSITVPGQTMEQNGAESFEKPSRCWKKKTKDKKGTGPGQVVWWHSTNIE
jgi:hypothetical protein